MGIWIWLLIGFLIGIVVTAIIGLIFRGNSSDKDIKSNNQLEAQLAKSEVKIKVLEDKLRLAESDHLALKQKLENDNKSQLEAAQAEFRAELAIVENEKAALASSMMEAQEKLTEVEQEKLLGDGALEVRAEDIVKEEGSDEIQINEDRDSLDEQSSPEPGQMNMGEGEQQLPDRGKTVSSEESPLEESDKTLPASNDLEETASIDGVEKLKGEAQIVQASLSEETDSTGVEERYSSEESVKNATVVTLLEDKQASEDEDSENELRKDISQSIEEDFGEENSHKLEEGIIEGIYQSEDSAGEANYSADSLDKRDGFPDVDDDQVLPFEDDQPSAEDIDKMPEDLGNDNDQELFEADSFVAAAPFLTDNEAQVDESANLSGDKKFGKGEEIEEESRGSAWPKDDSVWVGEYFNNKKLEGQPDFIREDEEINFDWEFGSPAPEIGIDNFSIRWTRQANLPPGLYRFTVTSDDGARLWVNDRLVISAWYDHKELTFRREMALPGGPVDLRLEYYEHDMEASVQCYWERIG